MGNKILSSFLIFLAFSCSLNSNQQLEVNVSLILSTENSNLVSQLYKLTNTNQTENKTNLSVTSFLQASQIGNDDDDPFEKYKNSVPYSPANDFRFRVKTTSEVIISLSPKKEPKNNIILLNSTLIDGYYLLRFSRFNIEPGLYNLKIVKDNSVYEKEVIYLK